MEQKDIDALKEANEFMVNERQFFLIPLIAKLLADREFEIDFQELREYGKNIEVEVEALAENKAIVRKLERNGEDENNI